MLRRLCRSSLLLSSLCVLVACGPSQETKRSDSDEQTDDSFRWNEIDSKPVVDSMTKDMLQSRWLQRWEKEHERRPTVIIGPVKNETMQHIDGHETVIQHISRRLTNADMIQLAPEIGEKIRDRHQEQEHMHHHGGGPVTSLPELAQEMGADVMVHGTVSTHVPDDQSGDTVSIFYTVTLELLNLDANQNAWLAEKEIKKMVPRSMLSL